MNPTPTTLLAAIAGLTVHSTAQPPGSNSPPAMVLNTPLAHAPWDFEVSPGGSFAAIHMLGAFPVQSLQIVTLADPAQALWTSPPLSVVDSALGRSRLAMTTGIDPATAHDTVYAVLATAQDTGNLSGVGNLRIVKVTHAEATTPTFHETVVTNTTSVAFPYEVLAERSVSGRAVGIVTNSWYGMQIFDLETGLQLANAGGGYQPPCAGNNSREFMAGTMVSTPSRIVTIYTASTPHTGLIGGVPPDLTPPPGFAAVLALSSATSPVVSTLSQFEYAPPCMSPVTCNCTFPGIGDKRHLHDITLTPDQTKAVISGWSVAAAIDVDSGAELFRNLDPSKLPKPGWVRRDLADRVTVNSVAASDEYAVFVGCRNTHIEPNLATDLSRYRITVVKLPTNSTPGAVGTPIDGGLTPGRAHDVAISPNGTKAVVSVRAPETVVLDLSGPNAHLAPAKSYATYIDPLAGPVGSNSDAWVANSAVTGNNVAVVIGTGTVGNPHTGQGVIALIDLSKDPGVQGDVKFIRLDPTVNYLPTDIQIEGQRAIVRAHERGATSSGPYLSQITIIDLPTRSVLSQGVFVGASSNLPRDIGFATGVDQIASHNLFAVTGGQNSGTSPLAPGLAQVLFLGGPSPQTF